MSVAWNAPLYWREERSGRLANIIARYLEGLDLNPDDLHILREYCRQWIWADGFRGPEVVWLRATLSLVTVTAGIRDWLADAVAANVDPL